MPKTVKLARIGKFYEKHRADEGAVLVHYYSIFVDFSQIANGHIQRATTPLRHTSQVQSALIILDGLLNDCL